MAYMNGPWHWSGSDLNGINEKGEVDSVIFCTAEYDDGYYGELHCEKEDRTLIETAPDLLDVCEEVSHQIGRMFGCPPWVRRLHDVIARATGKTNAN